MKECSSLFRTTIKKTIDTTIIKIHDSLHIWRIHANTILLRKSLENLHEIYLHLQKYNISFACFQEVNLDLLNRNIQKLSSKKYLTTVQRNFHKW